MDGRSTVILVRRARAGDREAWTALVERYYETWIRKYHGRLGAAVRKIYDTEDLVQSAIGDAMRDIKGLRNEAVFFTWVTSIVRHKTALARRAGSREVSVDDQNQDVGRDIADTKQPGPDEQVSRLDAYVRTLDTILDLFPEYPERMAAVTMKLLDGCSIQEMVKRLGSPERTVYHWLRKGTELLKGRMR